jgi:amino acid transporter
VFIGLNILIIGIEACGIALCLVGYRKHEIIETLVGYKRKDHLSFDIPLSVPLTFLLMIWGSGIVYLTYFTVFSGQPHEKLTWTPVEITTWTLKGIIGIVSGLIFTIKSLLRKQKTETSMND